CGRPGSTSAPARSFAATGTSSRYRIPFWPVPTQQKRQRKKSGRQARQQAIRAYQRQRTRRRTLVSTVVVVAIVGLLAGVAGVFSGGSAKKVNTTTPSTPVSLKPVAPGASIAGDTPCPKADGSSPRTTSFAKPPPICIDP